MRALLLVLALTGAAHADRPVVEVGASRASGATPAYHADVVAKVRSTHVASIRTCYATALQKNPRLGGTLTLTFIVSPRGTASPSKIAFDKALDPCVLKAVKAWKLGVPTNDARTAVEATFTFSFELAPSQAEADLMKGMVFGMTAEGSEGDMTSRRPGSDLGQQITKAQAPRESKAPKARISIMAKETFDESTLTAELVSKKIQAAYFAGLRRCYQKQLLVDTTLQGKLSLQFTVTELGRTARVSSRGPAAELDACITEMVKSWVFPIPKDVDGDATDAGFSFSFALRPD